jgi:hypothetical protein
MQEEWNSIDELSGLLSRHAPLHEDIALTCPDT